MHCRLANVACGTHFYTVNLVERCSDRLVRHADDLRAVMNTVKHAHPFAIVAMVVLPEHLHVIWLLLPGDSPHSTRHGYIDGGWLWRIVVANG